MTDQRRLSALDGLRGLAVIGVLLFHDDRLSGGFLGVDLFFVLSGFLITGLLVREVSTSGTLRLGRFWERRYRRLLPAYIVLLIAILPMMSIWGSPAQLDSARSAVLPALAHVANWHEIFDGADYWALFSDPSPLTHLWSLGIEQQFYLVWPVVVVLLATRVRRWRAALASLTVTLIAASAVLLWILYDPASPNRWYEGTDTRVSSILLGAMIAIIDVPALIGRVAAGGTRRPARVALELAQWGLVAALGYAWWSVDGLSGDGLAHGGLVACSTLAALLIAGLASPVATSLQRLLSIAPLRGAGAVSYGWYLWHWPVYVVLTSQRTGWHGWALSGARWSVSLAVALVSYFLIEMPIRSRQFVVSPRSLIVACVTGSVLVTGMVVFVPRPITTPAAFDTASIVVPTEPASSVSASVDAASTTVPRPLREVESIIWSGDSGAFEEAPALSAALAATGVSMRFAGYPGTGIAPQPKRWSVFVQPVLDHRPDVVIFQLSGWDSHFSLDEQRNAFDTYTDAVLGTGAAMVFVAPPPVDTSHVRYNVTVMLALAKQLAQARPHDVVVLDSLSFWGQFAYDIEGDGIPDRKPDGTHLCPQGAAKYANWLTAQLAEYFDGIDPAPPADWASGPWTTDQRYDNPLGACVALS